MWMQVQTARENSVDQILNMLIFSLNIERWMLNKVLFKQEIFVRIYFMGLIFSIDFTH